jgi:hypothetical protein
MTYSTGNSERDTRLRRAIGEAIACNEPMTLEQVAAHLPKDFDLEADELSGMLDAMAHDNDAPDEPPPQVERVAPLLIDATPDGHPFAQPKSLEKIEPPREAEAAEPHNDAADEAPQPEIRLTAQEANNAVLAAQNRLGEARININLARENTKRARGKLAAAITAWQNGATPYTQEQLVRDHLRSEQEKRRQRIEQGVPPQVKRVGKSALDISAAYSRDNTPEGAVRSRMQIGARRGAFPKSMQGQKNFDPARGAVYKPPSVKA